MAVGTTHESIQKQVEEFNRRPKQKPMASLGSLEKGITDIRTDMNRRFDRMDQRFNAIQNQMDQRFNEVDARFSDITYALGKVGEAVGAVVTRDRIERPSLPNTSHDLTHKN